MNCGVHAGWVTGCGFIGYGKFGDTSVKRLDSDLEVDRKKKLGLHRLADSGVFSMTSWKTTE